jgi:hypothetical protein
MAGSLKTLPLKFEDKNTKKYSYILNKVRP